MGDYKFGTATNGWKGDSSQTVTFIVTEDCDLRCKYCYICKKESDRVMDKQTAFDFIDYILSLDQNTLAPSLVIDFIGGEPFLEIDLINEISDYFKLKSYALNHKWWWNYRLSFSTNGLTYSNQKIQDYILKNEGKISVGITIDGTKEKHDLQRVFPDGTGSYDKVAKNIPLYLQQFSPSTKVTFASDDLPLLKESIIHLWEMGVTDVSANVVFEDVWKDGDDTVFYDQLISLADYVLENKLYHTYLCSLFSDYLGGYPTAESSNRTVCGAGKMVALDVDGTIYPCLRYKGYSLEKKDGWSIGDTKNGFNNEKLRAFFSAASKYQEDEECRECPISGGCSQCQGHSFDAADTYTNFQRAKFICKMHKARYRANQYYFARLYNEHGISKQDINGDHLVMHFLLSDNHQTYCCYNNTSNNNSTTMDLDMMKQGLEFCDYNFYQPIFVHPNNKVLFDTFTSFNQYMITHYISANFIKETKDIKRDIVYFFDKDTIKNSYPDMNMCILNLSQNDINLLSSLTLELLSNCGRVNINILDLDQNFKGDDYFNELMTIQEYLTNAPHKEVNVITDLLNIEERNNCKAGHRSFVFASNGSIYSCCGLYHKGNDDDCLGNTKEGLINHKNKHLYTTKYNPICNVCDTLQCPICIYVNKKETNEVNISPSYQCRKSHIERKVARSLQIAAHYDGKNLLKEIDYDDPILNLPQTEDYQKAHYSFFQLQPTNAVQT